MQTLALYTIFAAWRDALASDPAITAWCFEKYGRGHKLFAGLDLKRAPKPEETPYIILRAGAKVESEAEPYRYAFSVGWGLVNDEKTETGNIIELAGTKDADELGQLILECLTSVSPNYPVTRVEYDLDSIDFFPLHVGAMDLETEIDPAIGGSLIYP